MDEVIIKAPAKVNLFLKVLAKRPDGYHNIETLFEKIALFDRISLQKTKKGISVSSNKEGLPKTKENLAYKAASLMQDRYKIPLGIKIGIEKSIPIGAGLGGGSSDAAMVLIGINRLYDNRLSFEELKELARELGADVPFFLSGKSWAVGRERGDRIEEIDSHLEIWHILIMPPFPILSKDAYRWVDRITGIKDNRDIKKAILSVRKNDVNLLGKNLYNDLEGMSLEREKHLLKLKDILVEEGAKGAMISGSGPALFGILESKEEVMKVKERIEKKDIIREENGWQILIAPTFQMRPELTER